MLRHVKGSMRRSTRERTYGPARLPETVCITAVTGGGGQGS